jgi:hypothetical protein
LVPCRTGAGTGRAASTTSATASEGFSGAEHREPRSRREGTSAPLIRGGSVTRPASAAPATLGGRRAGRPAPAARVAGGGSRGACARPRAVERARGRPEPLPRGRRPPGRAERSATAGGQAAPGRRDLSARAVYAKLRELVAASQATRRTMIVEEEPPPTHA